MPSFIFVGSFYPKNHQLFVIGRSDYGSLLRRTSSRVLCSISRHSTIETVTITTGRKQDRAIRTKLKRWKETVSCRQAPFSQALLVRFCEFYLRYYRLSAVELGRHMFLVAWSSCSSSCKVKSVVQPAIDRNGTRSMTPESSSCQRRNFQLEERQFRRNRKKTKGIYR